MKRKSLCITALLVLVLVGCAAKTISPIDRALIYMDQYNALEATYKSQYEVSTDAEKKWLSEKVAPVLDEMRIAVKRYTQVALIGHDDETTRLEVIQLYRKAALALAEEVME